MILFTIGRMIPHYLSTHTNSIRHNTLDYSTPQSIRKSISNGKYEPISGPETKHKLNQVRNLVNKDIHLAICTNWITFAPKDGLSLGSNFEQIVHFPLKDMSYAPPGLMSSFTIFTPWQDDAAVAVSGTPEMVTDFAHHPMVLCDISADFGCNVVRDD